MKIHIKGQGDTSVGIPDPSAEVDLGDFELDEDDRKFLREELSKTFSQFWDSGHIHVFFEDECVDCGGTIQVTNNHPFRPKVQENRCPHCGQLLKFEGIDDDIDDGYCTFDFAMRCPNRKCRRQLEIGVAVTRTFSVKPARSPKPKEQK